MQVVFVHGVNTRDAGNGDFERSVSARSDRFNRLAFGSRAKIRSPYWGKYGLADSTLRSIPALNKSFQSLGVVQPTAGEAQIVDAAKGDFPCIVGSLSVEAIGKATLTASATQLHEVEDFWMSAAAYAEDRPRPSWLDSISSQVELVGRISKEVSALRQVQSLGAEWMPSFQNVDLHALGAEQLRTRTSGYLAQFLGDALMFFSRRDQSAGVRGEISREIIDAAKVANEKQQPLVLIGHSMGGAILYELLSDGDSAAMFERELGQPLKVDLLLTVGTQVGLFAELNLFTPPSGERHFAVPVANYWNVYDYIDTLSFLSAPVIPCAIDFEVNTTAGLTKAHTAYFENAMFFHRLNKRLIGAGLLVDPVI